MLISGVTVATTDSTARVPWRFWFGLVGIWACEVFVLLIGLRVLPDKVWLFLWPILVVLAAPSGFSVEYCLHLVRGSPTLTEKEELVVRRRSKTLGIMYFVPVFAAIVGWILPWMLAISVLVFLGLMARIAWLYTKRLPSGSSG